MDDTCLTACDSDQEICGRLRHEAPDVDRHRNTQGAGGMSKLCISFGVKILEVSVSSTICLYLLAPSRHPGMAPSNCVQSPFTRRSLGCWSPVPAPLPTHLLARCVQQGIFTGTFHLDHAALGDLALSRPPALQLASSVIDRGRDAPHPARPALPRRTPSA